MKGLIRKDIYCLRKSLSVFIWVSIGIIVLAVLFILSSRYGNVAKGIEEMKIENNMSEEDFYSFFQVGIWMVLLIPGSFMTMITECFKEDRKAGFYKQMLSIPLSDKRIVGSRYLACILLSVVSLAASLLAGFFVSLVSTVFSFSRLCGYVCCFNGALLIFMSITLFLIYVFGAEKADVIQSIPVIILLIMAICLFQGKVSNMTDAEFSAYAAGIMKNIGNLMEQKSILLYLAALCFMVLSFFASCKVFEKRKGNI